MTFKAPEDAQDIQEMVGALGRLGIQPVGVQEEFTGAVVAE